MWLKDNVPVTKRITISNSDSSSQLLIPSSERSDSGVYSILLKNLAGQETFSLEVRVTGERSVRKGSVSLCIMFKAVSSFQMIRNLLDQQKLRRTSLER